MRGITYATSEFLNSAEVLCKTALKNGCYSFVIHDQNEIDTTFEIINDDIIKAKRGAGYWLWKPYIIYMALDLCEDNEILVYFDAGIEVVNNLNHIADRMDQDVFLFGNQWKARHWTKGDIYKVIGVEPDDSKQVQASVIFVRNTELARNFIKEWLLYCQFPGLIDDSPSKSPNDAEFMENRHDQAILHVLAVKYGIKRHWWPAMYNNGAFTYDKGDYTDDYPALFHHHRKRNNEW